jgi:hypothetical protein
MINNPQTANPTLLSLRLGWLTVEAFGRLRRWARSGRPPSPAAGNAAQRFIFSNRDPNQNDQLLISLKQAQQVASQLLPNLPPPIPGDLASLLEIARQDIDALWCEFETWSRAAWNALQVVDPLAGQAFSYGGSLADTYWHAAGSGAGELPKLLRAQRLEGIAERFDSLAGHLPEHAAQVIHHTLYRWRTAGQLIDLNDEQKKHLLKRLEAQAKVWCDLLFGLQRAEDYLRREDRRLIAWGAFGATALLAILVALAAWLGVLLLAGAGRALLASLPGVQEELSGAGSALAAGVLNWQNWAALLATLSSVVVVLTGFITHLSGWMFGFHRQAKEWLKLRRIYARTNRLWQERDSSKVGEVT